MAMPGGELCTTISVCISGTMEPAVSRSTSGGGTCRHTTYHTSTCIQILILLPTVPVPVPFYY